MTIGFGSFGRGTPIGLRFTRAHFDDVRTYRGHRITLTRNVDGRATRSQWGSRSRGIGRSDRRAQTHALRARRESGNSLSLSAPNRVKGWGTRQAAGRNAAQFRVLARHNGGDGGIRTLDRALQPYNGLANRRLQPLGHISNRCFRWETRRKAYAQQPHMTRRLAVRQGTNLRWAAGFQRRPLPITPGDAIRWRRRLLPQRPAP